MGSRGGNAAVALVVEAALMVGCGGGSDRTETGAATGGELRHAENGVVRLEKVGDNGMRLTTTDKDPATGKSVVISDINLRRL